LLVDDGEDTRLASKWFFSNFDYLVESVCSAEEALACFNPAVHDLVVTENSMPGMSGVELAHIIKLRSPSTPVVMYTGSVPKVSSCLDAVINRPTHLLKVKQTLDQLTRDRGPAPDAPGARQLHLEL